MPAWKTRRCSNRSTEGQHGRNWQDCASAKGQLWQPGAGGMCLHTIVLDHAHPDRIFVAISAAGTFRSDDARQDLASRPTKA